MSYYYGETKHGKRIHLGNFVNVAHGKTNEVDTFCGSLMYSWEEGERPPLSKANDFCKNCFRSYAWNIMLDQAQDAAKISGWFDNLIDAALDSNWDISRVLAELKSKADELRPVELPVNVTSISA